MNIAIIGCGLVGRKRADAILAMPEHKVVLCCDSDGVKADALATHCRCVRHCFEFGSIFDPGQIDAAIIATPHDQLAPIALAMIKAGKHVLIEKPGARTAAELEPVISAAKERGVHLQVGFNHRYHPALMAAWRICDSGELGEIMHLRGRYGHGGRLGMETEWRCNPERSGGGELIDQGSHLIDLARWFLGDLEVEHSMLTRAFWGAPFASRVEDNAFLLLWSPRGAVAQLHASWTEWRNQFSFEVFGTRGEIVINGLGGSYGTERLTHYQMRQSLGPPEVSAQEWLGPDQSFAAETEAFLWAAEGRDRAPDSGKDALETLRIVDSIYEMGGAESPVL